MIGVGVKNWAAHPYRNYPQVPSPPPTPGVIASFQTHNDLLPGPELEGLMCFLTHVKFSTKVYIRVR